MSATGSDHGGTYQLYIGLDRSKEAGVAFAKDGRQLGNPGLCAQWRKAAVNHVKVDRFAIELLPLYGRIKEL